MFIGFSEKQFAAKLFQKLKFVEPGLTVEISFSARWKIS
jgi:hypothetical protein